MHPHNPNPLAIPIRSHLGRPFPSFDTPQQPAPTPPQKPRLPIKQRPQGNRPPESAYGTVIQKNHHVRNKSQPTGIPRRPWPDYLKSEVIIAAIETVLVAMLMISPALIPRPFGGLEGTTISHPGSTFGHLPARLASGSPLA